MKFHTFCCYHLRNSWNFHLSELLHTLIRHAKCRTNFMLRSLSAPGGSNEIPRRFSSLPLFFASGRFATFFFLAESPARRPA